MLRINKFIKKCWKVSKIYVCYIIFGTANIIIGMIYPDPFSFRIVYLIALAVCVSYIIYSLLEDVNNMKV
jgi:hypothetical protein